MSELIEWIINELCQQNAVMYVCNESGQVKSLSFNDVHFELTAEESERLDEIEGELCTVASQDFIALSALKPAVDAAQLRVRALERLALKHEVGVIKYRRRMDEESMADQEVGK